MIDQGARLVDIALEDGSAFELDGWKYISESFPENTVHFIGLLSDGGVHSRTDQLVGFMKGAAKNGAKRIRVHILTVSIVHPIPPWRLAFVSAAFALLIILPNAEVNNSRYP